MTPTAPAEAAASPERPSPTATRAIAAAPTPVRTQTPDWAGYQPSTIQEVIASNLETASHESSGMTLLPSLSYRIAMTYGGERRPMSSGRLLLWLMWMGAFAPPEMRPGLEDIFLSDVRFLDGTDEYWMPVQEVLLPYMDLELTAGSPVNLYISWIGVNREGPEVDWVFWVNEFQAE